MSTLHLTRGLPASGKTTWARAWVAEDPVTRARINRDDLRAQMFAEPDYTWPQESAVTEASRAAVKALLKAGRDVVADDMNLRPKYVREWTRFAAANGADVEIHEFAVTVEDSIARDAVRDRTVGESVIRKMVGKYTRKGELLPIPDEPNAESPGNLYAPQPGSQKAIIVDIDGTLALMGDRSPYDLSRVGDDLPNPAVVEAVLNAWTCEFDIIFCSGREDSVYEETRAWLRENLGPTIGVSPLLMRPAADKRKDSVVKRELFDKYIRDNYDVRYVFDDRKQVVEMWRSLGLTVFQVAEGDF